MLKSNFLSFAIFACLLATTPALAQPKGKQPASPALTGIGFYNVENLYDTIDDPLKDDKEYLPTSVTQWNTPRYQQKIDHISDVLSQLGNADSKGLSVFGLAEVENKKVVEDLVHSKKLSARKYNIVHYESPDARGIDVALVYDAKDFKVSKSVTYNVEMITDTAYKTRQELVVSGLLKGEKFCFVVCHWPSRRSGEAESEPNRVSAGKTAKRIADSVLAASPATKVIIMGDLNDNPTNASIKNNFNTSSDSTFTSGKDAYFDPMEPLYKKGIGSLGFKGEWFLFDQFILSGNLENAAGLKFSEAHVFNKEFVQDTYEKNKGFPLRTWAGKKYLGGYSDHFAVYILLKK